MSIQDIHDAWHSLDVGTDRDEIRTRWPALADAVGTLKHIHAIQYDAAAEQVRKESEEHSRVAEMVLGPVDRRPGRYLAEIVKLGEDYVVQVAGGRFAGEPEPPRWTFTVNGKVANFFHQDQEMAILHLIASRYDPNPNSNHMGAHYAAKLLGLLDKLPKE